MNSFKKNKKIIFAPRSLGVFLIQYMSIAPLGTVLIMLFVVIFSESPANYKDILILFFAFILPLLTIAFIMLYFPNKYLTRIVFDDDKNLLSKIKKRAEAENFDLGVVKAIVSKTIKTNPGCKYNLVFEEAGNNSQIIFNEDTPFGAGRWEKFSKKLSKITSVPLKKEFWAEDLNGKLSLIPLEDHIANKKHGLLILSIPLTLSFVGAIGNKITDTFQSLVLIGFIVVIINLGLSFLYFFLNRDKMEGWATNHLTLAVSILTMAIPYTMIYLFFVFALNGFQFPANY